MELDIASEGNFNTRNPEEAVRLIENLASSNNTKNTDYERRKSATLGKEELDDVKAKLDSVHKILKKQVSFAEDRKRKEKVPKHLKRGANDKEMNSFTKRILRISKDKPFEEAYFTHMLWMFFRETKETEEDIKRMFPPG
ncbi:hypothetical protein Bca101_031500 [Brassica carinata]